jgi:hypothetical protein
MVNGRLHLAKETLEVPTHLTREFLGADIGGATKEHPCKGAVTEERPEIRPKALTPRKGWDPFFPPGLR